MSGIVIRVRTQVGTWRLNDVRGTDTMATLRARVEKEHRTDLEGRPFSADALGTAKFDDSQTVSELMFANGTMIFAMVDAEKTGVHEAASIGARKITKDGNIISQDFESIAKREGFRPGMMPLRNMKLQWRLDEFIALDAQFEYKIKSANTIDRMCNQVKFAKACGTEFQRYVSTYLDFRQMRVGYLYGVVVDYVAPQAPPSSSSSSSSKGPAKWGKKEAPSWPAEGMDIGKAVKIGGGAVSSSSSSSKDDGSGKKGGGAGADTKAMDGNTSPSVRVEFIYEPPQDNTATSFNLLDDPQADLVDALAASLGLVKVGWIYAHPPREKGFCFSGTEIIEAAEQQVLAAGGVKDTPFVTVRCSIDPETNQVFMEPHQVSKQCMEMAAEGALLPSHNQGMCRISDTFTALVEGRPTKEVDNDFFVIPTAISYFDSDLLICDFPKGNRVGIMPTRDDLKKQLSKAGSKGWTMQTQLGDFALLLYLCEFLDTAHDLPQICRSVVDKRLPLEEGHTLMIRAMAGMD
jgi:hypothetical protein